MKKAFALVMALCLIFTSFAVANAEETAPTTVRLLREEREYWFPEGESISDNVITRFMEEKLNCDFDVVWTSENQSTTLNMMIASNDLPDMFIARTSQMTDLVEFGMIEPLTETIDTYLTGDVKKELSWNNNAHFIGATFDGEIYGVPSPSDFMDNIAVLYIRQDWLDNLGMEVSPDNFTLDTFLAICDAFTNQDPDGNGVNDTYALGLGSKASSNTQIQPMAHALGLHSDIWKVDEEGNVYYTDVQDEVKPLLELVQDMYAKGYVAEDYIATNLGDAISNNKCGMMVGVFHSALSTPQTAAKANPDLEWSVYPLPANPDGGYSIQAEIQCSNFLVIKKGFERPELAAQYMQLWYELWRGEYSDWFHGLNGNEYVQAQEDFKMYPPFWWDPPLKNAAISNKLLQALETGDDSYVEGDAEATKILPHIKEYLAGTENWYGFAQYHNHIKAIQVVHKYYGSTDASKYTFNLMEVVPVNSDLAAIKGLLKDLQIEYFNKIIMGADVDSTFEEFKSQWYEIGGEELTEYYNEWYATNGANFK